ncbi:hypothetical protein B484DRAFT_453302 [Ochromonadaceae sp. CCMP2298]|nr:hypothetical protein B484DRAFT_453302 [Ochromonadaceae sp. CCMP2298]|mmetsp:Transcript_12387/g.27571  ORF Transcript_12387/g.27571 Transcript_12387/m.27571 type:complete len:407 (-) Transcript_12387:169-1389(-)
MAYEGVSGFVRSLNLEEKLSPRKNAEIVWFYVFFPCFIAYLMILTDFINSKPSIGSIEVLHPSFEKLIYPGKQLEIITGDLSWAEGPLWIQDDAASLSYLMFSDTVRNRIYKWEEGKGMFTVGKTIYVESSGCNGADPEYCASMYEPGSNGLLRKDSTSLDLLAAQHGSRALTLIRENGTRAELVTHFNGSRLNSPNDMVISPDGHLYFTDPKYGLFDKQKQLLGGELAHSGVYMVRSEFLQMAVESGERVSTAMLMDGSLGWPNGLAFSPDFAKLYVSNSDLRHPVWKVYDVTDSGLLKNGRVFFDATALYKAECPGFAERPPSCGEIGAPDGMKVDIHGNLFASGPGGVIVLSPEGALIGRFRFDRPVSNVAFGGDGRLYFTASDIIARVWVKTKANRIISSKL